MVDYVTVNPNHGPNHGPEYAQKYLAENPKNPPKALLGPLPSPPMASPSP